VTGTATDFATTDVGRYMQFATNNDWYKISARASTTSLTIEAGFTGTSNVSGVDYTIRSFWYPLSASVDRIVSVKQARSPRKLGSMSPITLDRWAPFHEETSDQPYLYACWSQDSSNKWLMQFFPWPTVKLNMEVAYYKVATDLSANSDTGPMPQKLRDMLLVEGGIAFAYAYLNDSRYKDQWSRFNNAIDAAISKDGQNRGAFSRLEAIDEGPREETIITFPANYPNVRD